MKPGSWLVLLVGLALAGVCVRLGLWQLDRRHQKQVANQQLREALKQEPLTLGPAPEPIANLVGRRVRAVGVFDETRQVLLAGRAHDAMPGVDVVTPLRLASGGALLVDRGWLPSENAESVRPQQFPERGTRVVIGMVEALPRGVGGALWKASGPDSGAATAGDSVTLWLGRRLDLDTLRTRLPYDVAPYVLRELPGPNVPARPLRSTPEIPGESVHLGYALQWFAFAAGALVGSIALALRGARGARA